ncbi:oligopeptide ABC transporter ATP-binding protein Opp1F [Actinocorallia aurea]
MSGLLSVRGLTKSFGSGRAVDDVSFDLARGEILGLVGESGSGKSTTVRCIVGLTAPDAGRIVYDGIDVRTARRADLARFRREVQMVFQDPYSSLSPRRTVEQIVGEGLEVHRLSKSRAERRDRTVEVLELVGLGAGDLTRHPRSFSGGQRQRIAIARALAVRPQVLLCDEPVSALDVSVQAQVVNLLADMHERLGVSVLFIAHDLAVVRQLCARLVVLSSGRVAETGTREQVFGSSSHPYTQALLAAVPLPDPAAERARRATRKATHVQDRA